MKHALLAILLIINVLSLWAQEQKLSSDDTTEIQQQALRRVRQFEELLNLLAQPDRYFIRYNHREFIRNYYHEDSDYRIFRDSLVMVENDLTPEVPSADSALLNLVISDYLQTFFNVYEKSPATSVFFSNYKVSPVEQKDLVYVEVVYTSEFAGRHRDYPSQPYPIRKRKAIIEAQRQADSWQVLITEISNYSPDTTSPKEEVANKFSELPRVYQPGKTYSLPIQINPDAPPSSLILFRNNQQVEDLSSILTDSSFAWQVPKQIERGDGYQLRMYDPLSQKTIESSSFIIRRRFP